MRNSGAGTLNMPPFIGAVKWLVIVNAGIFVLHSLLMASNQSLANYFFGIFALTPALFFGEFWLWQGLTYGFLHGGTLHLLFNLLGLWMFGSTMQQHWGKRQFTEFYFLCVLGGGIIYALACTAGVGPLTSVTPVVGASAGIFGLLVAFGVLYADQDVILFPFPIAIKAKYMVSIVIAIAVLSVVRSEDPGSAIAHLGGALTGFLYVKLMPRRGLQFGMSEGYFGLRNRYIKWKRRRAARKFEVYMRKHDRSQYFDEHGNFRDPGRKDDDDKGKWVN